MLSVIAWPTVVLLLGLVVIFTFRGSIAGLLNRTKKLSKRGIETFDTPQLPAPAEKPDPLAEFMGTYDNPLLKEREAAINADLKQRGLVDGGTKTIQVLVRSLAANQIQNGFERIYDSIYKSQVDFLTFLTSRTVGAPSSEARRYYDAAKQAYPSHYDHYPFEAWLKYLESFNMVDRNGDLIMLALIGKEFLKWRMDAGRPGPFDR